MQNAIEKYLNVKDYKIIDYQMWYIFKNNTYVPIKLWHETAWK